MGEKLKEIRRETRLRSLLKGLSWRIIASVTTIIIAYTITKDATIAIEIGGIEVIAKLVFYYMHERAWQFLPRGTIRHIESEVFTKHGDDPTTKESSD
ncbi:DUF2061 domain-containing protein [Nitrospira defluvii]|nr:DUF2061 domain-containing protein [Nitrospira defluvii]